MFGVLSVSLGIVFGVLLGVLLGIILGVILLVCFCIVIGIVLGVVFSIVLGVVLGVVCIIFLRYQISVVFLLLFLWRHCLLRPVLAGQSPAPPGPPTGCRYSPEINTQAQIAGATILSHLFIYMNNCLQFWLFKH